MIDLFSPLLSCLSFLQTDLFLGFFCLIAIFWGISTIMRLCCG